MVGEHKHARVGKKGPPRPRQNRHKQRRWTVANRWWAVWPAKYGGPARETCGKGKRKHNPAGPAVFATSREVNGLLRKFPTVPLALVAKEAGSNTMNNLPMNRFPARTTCLGWIIFVECPLFMHCWWDTHPPFVDATATQKLYRALLPGIKKVCAMTALPRAPLAATDMEQRVRVFGMKHHSTQHDSARQHRSR